MGRAPENFFRLELIKTASDLDIRTRAQATQSQGPIDYSTPQAQWYETNNSILKLY